MEHSYMRIKIQSNPRKNDLGGGKVLGIIPDALMPREATGVTHYGEQVVVDSMHDRKFKMYQASDGFVALPGGFGTLDELLEVLYVFQHFRLRFPLCPIFQL